MKLKVQSDDIIFGTNILKVKVPKQLRNKFKSGVDYIDSALGGEGFTPSAVTFFTGTPGSGKTTMMLKLADSLTSRGALVVFNTAEESLYQVNLRWVIVIDAKLKRIRRFKILRNARSGFARL